MLIMASKSGFISKADRESIDRMMAEKEPQFILGETVELKVRFTPLGLESFNRRLHMRPSVYSKVEGEENTYMIRCTEMHAFNYFFVFGRDVEILAPETIRQKFIQSYRDAYMQYVGQENLPKGDSAAD